MADDGIIIPFIPDTTNAIAALQSTIAKLEQTGEVSEEMAAQYKAALTSMAANTAVTTAAVSNLGTGFKDMTKSIAGEELKQGTAAIKGLGDTVAGAVEKHTQLRTQVAQLTNTLGEMRNAGKAGTAEFKAMQMQVAELRRGLIESRAAVGALAQEFGGLKAAAQAVHGLNAAMQVGVGVSSMFADGNEKVEKEIRSMMGVMLIANGLSEFAEILGAKSILRLKAEALWLSITTTATEAFAEASVAAWAAATGGLVILVGLLGAATYAIINMVGAAAKEKNAIDELNNAYEQQTKILLLQIAVRKALGTTSLQDSEAQREILTNRIAHAQAILDVFRQNGDALNKEQKKQAQENRKIIEDSQDELKIMDAADFKERMKLLDEDADRKIEISKDGFAKEMALLKQHNFNKQLELIKAGQDTASLIELQNKEITERYRKENLSERTKEIEAKLALDKQETDNERKHQIELAELKNEAVQKLPGASKGDKDKSAADLAAAKIAINAKYNEKVNKQIDDAQKRQLELEIKGDEIKIAYTEKYSDKEYAIFKDKQDKKLQLDAITNKELQNTDSDAFKERVQQDQLEDDQWKAAKLKSDTDRLNENLKANEDYNLKLLEAQKKFHLSKQQLDKLVEAQSDKTGGKNSQDDDLKQVEIKLEEKQKLEKQAAKAAIDIAQKASDAIFSMENEQRNKRFNLEIEKLQKQSSFELDNNNLTQAQKISIQRKFDKEIAAVKLQQWRADQKSKEEQAAINGALAITAIFASTPPTIGIAPNPAFIIAMAMAVASTAASIGIIAAQKPPQFAIGTPAGAPDTLPGLKIVGEHGPELITTGGGERIVPHEQTRQILEAYGIPSYTANMEGLTIAKQNITSTAINEDSLAKKIATHMSRNPVASIVMDEKGFTKAMVTKGSKHTILNNKFKA